MARDLGLCLAHHCHPWLWPSGRGAALSCPVVPGAFWVSLTLTTCLVSLGGSGAVNPLAYWSLLPGLLWAD